MLTRWFKVTFVSPSWRSLNLWKGHLTIPKRSQRIARKVLTIHNLYCKWFYYMCMYDVLKNLEFHMQTRISEVYLTHKQWNGTHCLFFSDSHPSHLLLVGWGAPNRSPYRWYSVSWHLLLFSNIDNDMLILYLYTFISLMQTTFCLRRALPPSTHITGAHLQQTHDG